jgi:prenyltransferase beta subunit
VAQQPSYRLAAIVGSRTLAAMLVPACAAVAILVAACPARAASARDPKFQPNVEATVRYLQSSQRENGGFAEPGTETGPDFTAWVALALAAAGINPRDQTTAKQHYVAGHSAYSYLAEHAHEASWTTDFERELLVVDSAGTSPHDFGGVDLVGEILKRQIATGGNAGAFPHAAGSQTPGVNDTIFAILALSPVHEPAAQDASARAAQWLAAQQQCDGSWNWEYTPRTSPCNPKERRLLAEEARGEVDMTGAALEALNATGQLDPKGQERAFAYLHEAEAPNGGFPELLGQREPNVASTAWVVQAMWSAGINPETWLTLSSQEPLGYLASMQREDGHIRYEASEELNGMWMTAYAAPAFFGDPEPISEAPFVSLPTQPPAEPPSGDGGVSTNSGGGVIAGGGGEGAPLFSRPQPQSKGHTPGGVRQLGDKHRPKPKGHAPSTVRRSREQHQPKHKARKSAVNRHRNPGAARKTTVPTTTTAAAEPTTNHHGAGAGTASIGAGTGAKGSHPPTTGTGDRVEGSGSADEATGSGPGSGQTGTGRALPTPGAAGGNASGKEVKGVLIGAAGPIATSSALEPGAPGLRGAGAGHNQTPWLAIAIAAVLLLAALSGARLEGRRPRVIL